MGWYGGIDVGFEGGLAALEPETGDMSVEVMPTLHFPKTKRVLDFDGILRWVRSREWELILIEKATAMPKQGVVSTGRFLEGFGILQMACHACEVPYEIVHSKTWKNSVLTGTAKDKVAAVQHCQRRWPGIDLRKSDRARKAHDGLADALCIAEYASQRRRAAQWQNAM